MLNQIILPAASDVHIFRRDTDANRAIFVGAYCRVSTDLEVQRASLELQMTSYRRIIDEHSGWVLADIYADKGLSGTSVNRRNEFMRMMEDARAGRLNYVLVKSVSRFARNTVDLLKYTRELNEIGVHVYFEKEHLDTGHSSEFLLTLFGAHAQEEIISLSDNMKVGRRMRFARGEQQWTHIYGYKKGWEIVKSEAAVIRRIFDRYLGGEGLPAITRALNDEGIPNPTGKGSWQARTVSGIMRNEKYAGHMLMQKSYIEDPIKHKKVSNRNALVPQYFKNNHHAAIVTDDEWAAANAILTMKDKSRGTTQYPYYGILRCPFCGAAMVRFHYNKSDFYWTCAGENEGTVRKNRSSCPPFAVHEADINRALYEAGLPLEYWMLSRQAASVSFPPDDWNHLLITPQHGGEPVSIDISYKGLSNHPLPTITEILEDGDFKPRRATYINGGMVEPSKSELIVGRIEALKERVRSLVILPPKPWEADVPRVEPKNREETQEGETV